MDMVLPFGAGFIDSCSGCMKGATVTKVDVLYYKLWLSKMTGEGCKRLELKAADGGEIAQKTVQMITCADL